MDWYRLFWFIMLVVAILMIGGIFANPAFLIEKALRSDDEPDSRDS